MRAAPVLLAVVLLSTTTACATEASDSRYPDMTLAQAKSNVQLLRNDAASRIPEAAVDTILVSSDLSAGCEPESADPEGLVRSWQSGARISLTPGADLDAIIDDLVATFTDQGWEVAAGSSTRSTTLRSDIKFTDIALTTVAADDESGRPAEVLIELSSPCVLTDGESSKEVRSLEAMAF